MTINQLVDIVEDDRRRQAEAHLQPNAPKGVHGRNSDNTLISSGLGWAPADPLEVGLEQTYRWIYDQMTGGRRFEQRSAVPA